MTRAYETTGDRYVELAAHDNDPACGKHAHCVCGGLMAYSDCSLLVCQDCGTAALADPKSWEQAGVQQ